MAVLDEDFGADLTLVEGDGGVRSSPAAEPVRPPRDWQMLYEQAPARAERERVRADAAEARAEELRWAEVAARSDAGSWKSRFRSCRRRLSEANEEAKELRRAAKATPSLRAEAVRLETLLSEAGVESNEDSTIEALRKENARLRKALAGSEAREGAIGRRRAETRRRRTTLERPPDQKDTIRTLRKEITRLNNEAGRRDKQVLQLNKRLDREQQRTESIRGTAGKLSRENLRLHREVRILGDSEARARSLSDEVFWLRHALEVSKAGKEKLKARLAKLRAAGATLSKLPSDEAAQLRAALRRSRRQKTTINVLRKNNARLRRTVRKLEVRKAALEVLPAKLRAIRKASSARSVPPSPGPRWSARPCRPPPLPSERPAPASAFTPAGARSPRPKSSTSWRLRAATRPAASSATWTAPSSIGTPCFAWPIPAASSSTISSASSLPTTPFRQEQFFVRAEGAR